MNIPWKNGTTMVIWGFPKMTGYPIAGWFSSQENPMDKSHVQMRTGGPRWKAPRIHRIEFLITPTDSIWLESLGVSTTNQMCFWNSYVGIPGDSETNCFCSHIVFGKTWSLLLIFFWGNTSKGNSLVWLKGKCAPETAGFSPETLGVSCKCSLKTISR